MVIPDTNDEKKSHLKLRLKLKPRAPEGKATAINMPEKPSSRSSKKTSSRWRRKSELDFKSPPSSKIGSHQGYLDQCRECAETALNYFNSLAASQLGATYELVDIGISGGFVHRIANQVVYHSNIHAKLMNSPPGTPSMLFFAELSSTWPNPALQVDICSILGQTGSGLPGLHFQP